MRKLLMLGAGLEQVLAIKEAQALGLTVLACDANPNAPGLDIADIGLVFDIKDTAGLIRLGREHEVAGIFCHAVEIPVVVAEVAEALGLPGLSPAIARRATHKHERIRCLKAHGIPTADYVAVHRKTDLADAARTLGYPHVLKPVDNAGSRGVRIVTAEFELEAAWQEAQRYGTSQTVLLEQVLTGPQISTETVVYDGQMITFAFADRNYEHLETFFPYFVEDGINFPSNLPEPLQAACIDLVERTIHVLGITNGVAKGDLIVHDGVPHVIEMACRTSGGWFGAGSIPIATGANMLRPLIQMAMGDAPDLDVLKPTRRLPCAQRYLIPRETGRIRAISGLAEAAESPGVAMFVPFLPKIGDHLVRATHHAQRYAQVICTGETLDEAIAACSRALSKIRIDVG